MILQKSNSNSNMLICCLRNINLLSKFKTGVLNIFVWNCDTFFQDYLMNGT